MAQWTPKKERFCQEYLVDLNAAHAAVRAGYSAGAAKEQGYRLLQEQEVLDCIAHLSEERSKRTGITADKVLQELAKLAFADIREMFDENGNVLRPRQLSDEAAAAVQSIEVVTNNLGDGEVEYVHKFKLSDKGQNLERLGRHLKLFTDRIEHEGEVIVKQLTGVPRGS